MGSEAEDISDMERSLLLRAVDGDEAALNSLFSMHRERLKAMVRLRMSRRLQGRVDDSDVLQDAFVDLSRKLPEYLENREIPFFIWLRHLTGLKLNEIHRKHLGTQLRAVDKEVSIHCGALPEANSVSLAAHLLGTVTSPSDAATFEG